MTCAYAAVCMRMHNYTHTSFPDGGTFRHNMDTLNLRVNLKCAHICIKRKHNGMRAQHAHHENQT